MQGGGDNRSTNFRNIFGNELIQMLQASFRLWCRILLKKIPFRNNVIKMYTQVPSLISGIGRYKFKNTFSPLIISMSSIIQ